MPRVRILHKGWRANDTLLECPSGYILTYFTHKKQEGVASVREGLFLYKNSRLFPDRVPSSRVQAMGLYHKRLPRRYIKYWNYTSNYAFFEKMARGEVSKDIDATDKQVDDIIYKRGKGVK